MAYLGNTPTQQGFIPAIDYFSGNASTTAFTLSRPVASVAQVQAVIENVPQNPGDAFTVSGNTITFTSAPPSGTNNIYVYYTSPITQVIQPGQGTVGTAQLANGVTINFADGSAAAPSITNLDDTNTGIFFPAADTIAFAEGGVESARFDSNGRLGIGTSSPNAKLQSIDAVQPFIAGLTNGNFIFREFGSTAANNTLELNVRANSGKSGYVTFTEDAVSDRWSVGIQNGVDALRFISGTPTSGTERMRLDGSGNLLVGTTSSWSGNLRVQIAAAAGASSLSCTAASTASSDQVYFRNPNGIVGYINSNGSSTSYVTSSDYRLKENIAPMTGALATVQALKPVTYKWKSDGSDGQGFIAHELAEIVPDCVTGEKDAVETYTDEDGNEQTSIKAQGIDTSFLVATLTAAIQEQQAIITDLKARIEILESK
jgi:hypothetical protein